MLRIRSECGYIVWVAFPVNTKATSMHITITQPSNSWFHKSPSGILAVNTVNVTLPFAFLPS